MPWESRRVTINDLQRQHLSQIAQKENSSPFERQRAKIVLMLADGHKNKDIAQQLNVHENTVVKWRGRWTGSEAEANSVLDAITLTGRPRSVLTSDKLNEVETAIQAGPPEGKLRWTVRTLAKKLGLPVATTQRALVELKIELNTDEQDDLDKHIL